MYLQYKQVQLAVGLYCGLRSEWGWLSLCSSKEQQYYCLQYVRNIWVNNNADMKKRLPLFYFLRLFYLVCASSLIIYQFESVSFTLNLTHWKQSFIAIHPIHWEEDFNLDWGFRTRQRFLPINYCLHGRWVLMIFSIKQFSIKSFFLSNSRILELLDAEQFTNVTMSPSDMDEYLSRKNWNYLLHVRLIWN